MEWPQLIAYVDGRIKPVIDALGRLEQQIDQHEKYHSNLLEKSIEAAKSSAWSRWGLIAAFASAGAAWLAVILVALH